MKILKFNLRYVTIIMVSVALFSCSKGDVGDIGPIGPAGQNGIAGINGQNGQDGVNGQDGEDGKANVVSSPWITADFADTPQRFVSFSVDDSTINEFNASSAAVYAYGRFVGGDGTINVNRIPYTRVVRSYFFRMLPASNKILFIGNTVDNSSVVFDELEKVRYVVIPFTISGKNSTASSTISEIKSAGIDMNNYEEVANYFGWND